MDTTFTATATEASNGHIALDSICKIPQGTTESGRIGRKVVLKAVSIRLVYTLEQTTAQANTDDGCRVIVYHDRQTNGTAASVTDILKSNSYLSFNNLANKDRFKILSDKFYDLSATAGAYDGTTSQFARIAKTKSLHLKLDVPIEFSSTAGDITEIRSNNIGILVKSDQGKIAVAGLVRVRYGDN